MSIKHNALPFNLIILPDISWVLTFVGWRCPNLLIKVVFPVLDNPIKVFLSFQSLIMC